MQLSLLGLVLGFGHWWRILGLLHDQLDRMAIMVSTAMLLSNRGCLGWWAQWTAGHVTLSHCSFFIMLGLHFTVSGCRFFQCVSHFFSTFSGTFFGTCTKNRFSRGLLCSLGVQWWVHQLGVANAVECHEANTEFQLAGLVCQQRLGMVEWIDMEC